MHPFGSSCWLRFLQVSRIGVSMTRRSTFRSRKPIAGTYRTLRFTFSTVDTLRLIPKQMRLRRLWVSS
jgi:hypothetical protein